MSTADAPAGGRPPLIELRGVTGSYRTAAGPVIAIDRLDLSVARGDALCIVGRSGSGKSTLLDIIGTLLRPAAGSYLFDGRPVELMDDRELAALRNRCFGFVFQSFHLLDRLSVRDNILLPGSYGEKGGLRERADALIGLLGLAGLAERRPSQLSGGQRQRVAIARALVRDPDVILADEPTGSLDSATAAEVLDLLREAGGGRTLLVITHDPAVARSFPAVVELSDGQVARRAA